MIYEFVDNVYAKGAAITLTVPSIKYAETYLTTTVVYYYQAKPKLEPSCPLAIIVNCRTASRIRRIDREPLANQVRWLQSNKLMMAEKKYAYPNTAFTKASLASIPAREQTKSLYNQGSTTGKRNT